MPGRHKAVLVDGIMPREDRRLQSGLVTSVVPPDDFQGVANKATDASRPWLNRAWCEPPNDLFCRENKPTLRKPQSGLQWRFG